MDRDLLASAALLALLEVGIAAGAEAEPRALLAVFCGAFIGFSGLREYVRRKVEHDARDQAEWLIAEARHDAGSDRS